MKRNTESARGRRAGPSVGLAWLVMLDVLLAAVGVGLFYLYLGVLPQAYAVVNDKPLASHAVSPRVVITSDASPAAPEPSPTLSPSRPTAQVRAAAPTRRATETAKESAVPTGTASPTLAPTLTPAPADTPALTSTATALPAPAGTGVPPARRPGFTSGEVVRTASEYRSANVSVDLAMTQRKGVTYYVQDIYVRNVENLRSAFARNTYGRSIADRAADIAAAYGAIGAINGDYYGAGMIGAVIRNGTLYNARPDGDVCVLFYDGTMKVYSAREFDADQVMAAGAYQAWSFGPSLLDDQGRAIARFDSGIAGLNPRTAIGYVEPGHYLFVVVDGRQPGYSNGMTLAQLAALFEELGAKVAYNLDGGQTSVMTFGGTVVNRPFHGGRKTSDIIYVGE